MTALSAVRRAAGALESCTLAEVLDAAELQTRTDCKYLLTPGAFAHLVAGLRHSHRVLEIDALRVFGYESVYFDTPELDSYLGAARGRRRKFKVRTRTYVDTEACMLEVKRAGGRGETIKERTAHPLADRSQLGRDARRFVAERAGLGKERTGQLAPRLTTTYQRMTLVDLDSGSRLTCDADLALTDPDGRSRFLGGPVLVETKSAGGAGEADRLLWRRGVRPIAISKYAVGMAALRPDLPANRWHRVLRDHFGTREASLAW